LASRPEYQPEILAAFWSWKGLNAKADVGDFKGCTKLWNGGLIGYADREHLLSGNTPYIERLAVVERLEAQAEQLPGAPPSPAPPPEAIENATAGERRARTGAAAGAAAASADQAAPVVLKDPAKDAPAPSAGTQVPPPAPPAPFLPPWVGGVAIVLAVVVAVALTVLIGRKIAAVKNNWR
jgi:hypothetical protein